MGKVYTPTTVNGGNQTQTTLNQNFSDIEVALEDVLSRSGAAPNTMSDVVDMNSNRVINGSDATNPTDLVTLRQLTGAVVLPGQSETFSGVTVGTQVLDLGPVVVQPDTVSFITANVVGASTTSIDQFAYTLKAVAHITGANVLTIVGSVASLFEVTTSVIPAATVVAIGSDFFVRVTGLAANSINWKTTVTKVEELNV